MSEIVKRLEARAMGDGSGNHATRPYTVFDANLDRAAAAEITRLTTALENARKDVSERAAALVSNTLLPELKAGLEDAVRLKALDHPEGMNLQVRCEQGINKVEALMHRIRSLTPKEKAT